MLYIIYIYNIPAQGTSVFVLGMLVLVARLRRIATSVDSSVSGHNNVSIRQHTSAYVSIRQHTSAYVAARLRRVVTSVDSFVSGHNNVSIRQHTSAYVSIRRCTSPPRCHVP